MNMLLKFIFKPNVDRKWNFFLTMAVPLLKPDTSWADTSQLLNNPIWLVLIVDYRGYPLLFVEVRCVVLTWLTIQMTFQLMPPFSGTCTFAINICSKGKLQLGIILAMLHLEVLSLACSVATANCEYSCSIQQIHSSYNGKVTYKSCQKTNENAPMHYKLWYKRGQRWVLIGIHYWETSLLSNMLLLLTPECIINCNAGQEPIDGVMYEEIFLHTLTSLSHPHETLPDRILSVWLEPHTTHPVCVTVILRCSPRICVGSSFIPDLH